MSRFREFRLKTDQNHPKIGVFTMFLSYSKPQDAPCAIVARFVGFFLSLQNYPKTFF